MTRVLLIEDDDTSNFIAKRALKRSGFENVEVALNGRDGFNFIENSCPDIILLDINMPIMDGWEFLEENKTKTPCKGIKIAMLTSSIHPNDRQKAESYSCVVAYIEKPLTTAKIKSLQKIIDF